MKVGVTGGYGFLGQYVVEELKKLDIKPIVITRKNFSEDDIQTDYSKDNLLKSLEGLDAIIHLAYNRGVSNSIVGYHESERITENLYFACSALNISNIVFASTISVYSNVYELPWTEKNNPLPDTNYGISKLTCELIGNKFSKKENMYIKNLRLAHLYGFNEKNNYMINLFMRQAYNKNTLMVNSDKNSKREFLYVKDAARSIVLSVLKKDQSFTINIGSNDYLTNLEVAEQINLVMQNNNNLIHHDITEKSDITSSYMDHSFAFKMIDYKPQYSFENAIQEIYEQMKGLVNVPEFY